MEFRLFQTYDYSGSISGDSKVIYDWYMLIEGLLLFRFKLPKMSFETFKEDLYNLEPICNVYSKLMCNSNKKDVSIGFLLDVRFKISHSERPITNYVK